MTPGSYYFDLIAYYDGDVEVNRQPVKVTILPCQSSNPPSNTGTGTGSTIVTTPITEVHVIPPITGNVISTPAESTGFTGTKEYVLLLVVGVFIVLLLIVLEVTLLLRK
jgi:hypothetical protein